MMLALLLIAAESNPPLAGRWRNPSGSVIVKIEPCGPAYCGTVDWATAEAKADAERGGTQALIGTQLMSGFQPAGNGRWRGHLFIPDMNRHSKAELQLTATGQLKVTGCMVARMICRSQLWSRAD